VGGNGLRTEGEKRKGRKKDTITWGKKEEGVQAVGYDDKKL